MNWCLGQHRQPRYHLLSTSRIIRPDARKFLRQSLQLFLITVLQYSARKTSCQPCFPLKSGREISSLSESHSSSTEAPQATGMVVIGTRSSYFFNTLTWNVLVFCLTCNAQSKQPLSSGLLVDLSLTWLTYCSHCVTVPILSLLDSTVCFSTSDVVSSVSRSWFVQICVCRFTSVLHIFSQPQDTIIRRLYVLVTPYWTTTLSGWLWVP